MAVPFGCERGGILWLVGLIDEHRPAFDYDWRSRFGVPVSTIGTGMPWDEALRLAILLHKDPASMLFASSQGWDYPVSREALLLMDIFDLEHAVNSKKTPKPHGMRPGKSAKDTTRYGNTGGRTVAQVKGILADARAGAIPV